MAYVFVSDFKFGMDRRRPRYAGVPGTLWLGKDVHLTRGGDIERRKSFVPTYTGLSGTFGLGAIYGQVYVFGSADLAASMPLGVQYQRLQAPGSPAMVRVLSVRKFDQKFYVIAEYDDGSRYHFYNGSRVTTLDTVADGLASTQITYQALASVLNGDSSVSVVPVPTGVVLTAAVAGTPFTLTTAIANGGATNDQTVTQTTVQANVAPVAEVRATATFYVTGGSFDPNVNTISKVRVGPTIGASIDLLPGPVSWVNSDSATATAVASTINESTDAHGYSAAAVGSAVTISAIPGSGATANANAVFIETSGSASATSSALFTGGVDAVQAVGQVVKVVFGGTFEPLDTITATLNGTAYKLTGRAAATGSSLHVQNNRVWTGAGPAVLYCKLNDPTDWTDATVTTGAGRIVISTDSDGTQYVTGLAPYQGFMAVFSETSVIVYQLGTDPANFGRVQELPNTGTLAGRAVTGYGANDVFYLDTTGVRSLRARDASNAAFVSDAGTAFDPFMQQTLAATTRRAVQDADSLIEPATGAYWLSIGSKIFVLTNYPGTEIRGWTYYDPGFPVTDMERVSDRVFIRSADTIYVLGGLSGSVFPAAGEVTARVELPFLTARDDAGQKQFLGFDIGAVNNWSATALIDPKDETQSIYLGIYSGATYADENAEIIGQTSHLALTFECADAGPAELSSLALHHDGKIRA